MVMPVMAERLGLLHVIGVTLGMARGPVARAGGEMVSFEDSSVTGEV